MEGFERIERLLAVMLVRDMKEEPQGEKALQLSRAGLTNTEIASLLGTTAAVVSQQLYEQRGTNRRGKSSKKKAKRGKKTQKKSRRR
jgi:predicted transcriptional regulator